MLVTNCYTREELEHYLHGWADDDLSNAIELHVEACSNCEDTLSELDAGEDTLIRTLKEKANSRHTHAPAWVEQLANVSHDTSQQVSELDSDVPAAQPEELGDYELVSVLGQGGMSVVFAARHKHLGREVALKVLLPMTQQHAVSRDRFAREMRAVGGLDHAAIVRATDAGEWNETLYLVMEQIVGVDLKRVSQFEGPLCVADACAIGIDVALGLAHAHAQGVVHRDIKPSNLMLDSHGTVKILDFGLARVQSAACDVSLQTTMGQLLGTLDYMAPEQASGSEVDARADIYALGATLFKLLTGAPPHGRSADMPIIEYLSRLANREAAGIDEHRDHLPSQLVELIGAMLQRDPARRIASADEVAQRLQPFATDADLRALAARSIEKATDSQDNSVASVKDSLAELWPRLDVTPPHGEPLPAAIAGLRPISPVGWAGLATALVSLLGLVVLTIVLTLKSQEGEIRIESELDNVKVEVVDEKDRVETIAVDQGGAITTVRAGRYRIRLDSPSNGIEVTPQEVLVKRNQAVIARVRKTAKPRADGTVAQRDPMVAMEAELQLAETAAELEQAKRQPDENAELIRTLEEKLARLRALSRPIPTEPVYEGRTLEDWVAQMKFEQEEEARKTAAENVLNLANTRPPEERMELILDASSRLFAWSRSRFDLRLYNELHPSGSRDSSTIAKLILAVDHEVASSHLERELRSDDRLRRDHALWICLDMRDQIRRGDWATLLTALEMRSESDTDDEKSLAQLTLAVCVPDGSRATELLASIDTSGASAFTMLATMYAANERKLEIPRDQEIVWAATYLGKISDSRELVDLWQQPKIGPFRDVDWDRVDDSLQKEINAVVGPLLDSFEQRLADVRDNQHDQQLQLKTALKSKILSQIIEQANLTGQARDKAIDLLGKRLEQLIRFRPHVVERRDDDMDTPASVAVAILLLTGSVPESIKRGAPSESGYMSEQLDMARETLLRQDARVVMMRGIPGSSRGARLADWYPYELLAILHESTSRMQAAISSSSRRPVGQSGRPFPPSYSSSTAARQVAQLLLRQPSWQVDWRLTIDYAMSSGNDNPIPLVSFAEIAREFLDFETSDARGGMGFGGVGGRGRGGFGGRAELPPRVTRDLRRHPQFAQAIAEWVEESQDQKTVEFAFRLWSTTRSTEEAEAKLNGWLESGHATHIRAAMQELVTRDEERFFNVLAKDVVEAINHIAEEQPLNSRDMYFLDSLGDNAPRAASYATGFLTSWLDNPDERARQAEIARGGSVLKYCVNILLRSQEHAKQIRDQVQQALKEPKGPFRDEDRAELQRLWKFISDLPE